MLVKAAGSSYSSLASGTEDAHGWSLPWDSSGVERWELALLASSLETEQVKFW